MMGSNGELGEEFYCSMLRNEMSNMSRALLWLSCTGGGRGRRRGFRTVGTWQSPIDVSQQSISPKQLLLSLNHPPRQSKLVTDGLIIVADGMSIFSITSHPGLVYSNAVDC